jgi:hypothetical protein
MDVLGTKTGALTLTLGLAEVEVDGVDVNAVLSHKPHIELLCNNIGEWAPT